MTEQRQADLAPTGLVGAGTVAQYTHRGRFEVAKRLVLATGAKSVFDYGTGRGYFLDLLAQSGIPDLVGYDPYETGPRVTSDLASLTGPFDCIACLEVLEHLEDGEIDALLGNVARLLAPAGTFVVSVPVMIGPVGFVKVAKEWRGSGLLHKDKYTLGAALGCLVGRPPRTRWKNRWNYYHHLGFDHRRLRERLSRAFASIREERSPFPALPSGLNSQVFFVCTGMRGVNEPRI